MRDQEDQTITDFTEVIDSEFYRSKKPEDIETYGEKFEGVEDTVIRMVLTLNKSVHRK